MTISDIFIILAIAAVLGIAFILANFAIALIAKIMGREDIDTESEY